MKQKHRWLHMYLTCFGLHMIRLLRPKLIRVCNNLVNMCPDDMARPWGHKAPWGGLNTRKQLRDEHSNPAQVEGPHGPPKGSRAHRAGLLKMNANAHNVPLAG